MINIVERLRRIAGPDEVPDDTDIERDCTEAADEIERLRTELEAARRNAEYYKWRLKEIIPLFEEARDALTAISMPSARLHGLDLSLAIRMDAAGTRTREDFDAATKESGHD